MNQIFEQCSPNEQKAFKEIAAVFVKHMNPEIIYSVYSNCVTTVMRDVFTKNVGSEESEFNGDILIVMPDNVENNYDINKALTELYNDKRQRGVQAIGKRHILYHNIKTYVHTISEVKGKLSERNLFFSWLRVRAPIIYQKNNAHQLLPQYITMTKRHIIQADKFFMSDAYNSEKDYMNINFTIR